MKYWKWIRIGLEAALIVVFAILCVAINSKNAKIRSYKDKDAYQTEIIDSLTTRCDRLGSMESVVCNVTFKVENKAVFGVNNVSIRQLAEQTALYTRDYVLDSAFAKITD